MIATIKGIGNYHGETTINYEIAVKTSIVKTASEKCYKIDSTTIAVPYVSTFRGTTGYKINIKSTDETVNKTLNTSDLEKLSLHSNGTSTKSLFDDRYVYIKQIDPNKEYTITYLDEYIDPSNDLAKQYFGTSRHYFNFDLSNTKNVQYSYIPSVAQDIKNETFYVGLYYQKELDLGMFYGMSILSYSYNGNSGVVKTRAKSGKLFGGWVMSSEGSVPYYNINDAAWNITVSGNSNTYLTTYYYPLQANTFNIVKSGSKYYLDTSNADSITAIDFAKKKNVKLTAVISNSSTGTSETVTLNSNHVSLANTYPVGTYTLQIKAVYPDSVNHTVDAASINVTN